MSITCVAPIRKGDEITLSYFGIQALEAEPRNIFLRDRFGFECQCDLCTNRVDLTAAAVQARLETLTSSLG